MATCSKPIAFSAGNLKRLVEGLASEEKLISEPRIDTDETRISTCLRLAIRKSASFCTKSHQQIIGAAFEVP